MKDQEVVFYILLELQSKVDFQMPFRLLAYMMEIWRDILKNTHENKTKRKSFKLPIIFGIVLYIGVGDWTVQCGWIDVLCGGELFDVQILDFIYTLIDVN